MRSNLSTAVATLLFSSLSYGQGPRHEVAISIDESKIRAHLERDSTVISIPIANFASQPVKAELALAWLRTDAHATEAPVQTITIPPGQSTIDTPLALESPSIWTRLRYSLTPARQDARAFPPASGSRALLDTAPSNTSSGAPP